MVQHSVLVPAAADLRAEMARRQVEIYRLSARVGLHPSHLGQLLRGRRNSPSASSARSERRRPVAEQRSAALLAVDHAVARRRLWEILLRPRTDVFGKTEPTPQPSHPPTNEREKGCNAA